LRHVDFAYTSQPVRHRPKNRKSSCAFSGFSGRANRFITHHVKIRPMCAYNGRVLRRKPKIDIRFFGFLRSD